MTLPFLLGASGSLLVATPATAERRRAVRDDDSKKSIGKTDRSRDDRKEKEREKERPARRERVADLEEVEDSDGPEAQAVLPVKLDDLIEVAVRLSPELARAKAER